MPLYAYLNVELTCPSCGTAIADMLWFQWGYCPGELPRKEYIYHIGDALYWKVCKDGRVPAWTFFEVGGNGLPELAGANVGDPDVRNLIVRDSAQSWLAEACKSCGQQLGGAALEIRDGIITRGWLYMPGDLNNNADIFLIEAGDALKPMIEWNDYPMGHLKDC